MKINDIVSIGGTVIAVQDNECFVNLDGTEHHRVMRVEEVINAAYRHTIGLRIGDRIDLRGTVCHVSGDGSIDIVLDGLPWTHSFKLSVAICKHIKIIRRMSVCDTNAEDKKSDDLNVFEPMCEKTTKKPVYYVHELGGGRIIGVYENPGRNCIIYDRDELENIKPPFLSHKWTVEFTSSAAIFRCDKKAILLIDKSGCRMIGNIGTDFGVALDEREAIKILK